MAVTGDGVSKATLIRCEQIESGGFFRPLPWSFIEFADASEQGVRYVMPASNGIHELGAEPYRVKREAMRNSPFPHEIDVPSGLRELQTSNDESKPGPHALHFFGNQV
jgi:hypothetical protein